MFIVLFQMGEFSMDRVAGDGNTSLRSLPVLLETVTYCFVFQYFIADGETVLLC
jgi:hypothetical protein